MALLRNLKKKVLPSVRPVRQQDVFGDTFLSAMTGRINGVLHPFQPARRMRKADANVVWGINHCYCIIIIPVHGR